MAGTRNPVEKMCIGGMDWKTKEELEEDQSTQLQREMDRHIRENIEENRKITNEYKNSAQTKKTFYLISDIMENPKRTATSSRYRYIAYAFCPQDLFLFGNGIRKIKPGTMHHVWQLYFRESTLDPPDMIRKKARREIFNMIAHKDAMYYARKYGSKQYTLKRDFHDERVNRVRCKHPEERERLLEAGMIY